MFAGFNARITDKEFFSSSDYSHIQDSYNLEKENVKHLLLSYIKNGVSLDASQIEKDWFPKIQADVFISHSHKDRDFAIRFAGWLNKTFGISSFIDSCVWGNSEDLLKIIDEEYCANKKEDGSTRSYDYNKRNQSTAHIHMILNTALHKMIYKSEYLIFLNTPNSLKISNSINESITGSPWIYSELVFSALCNKVSNQSRKFTEYSQLEVDYNVNLSHLITINDKDIEWLKQKNNGNSQKGILKELYNYKTNT